jgi:beta-glucanase (GH16 family)
MKLLSLLLLLGASSSMAAVRLSGAEIYSRDTVQYGRWEIRMQVAATPGSVSSFFTYYNNSYLGSPEPWREIDIEILGKDAKGFQSNLITGEAASKTMSEVFHDTTESLAQSFHTYTLDWTPDSVVWKLDGRTVRKDDTTNTQLLELRDRFQTYRMNLWASSASSWVGKLDTTKLPVVQVVNWMAYSKYTPGAGTDGSNFTPVWTDDFDKFDTKRWSKGNWTFDGNLATFNTSNAVVKDGYLVLLLATEAKAGQLPTLPTDPLGNKRTTTTSIQTKSVVSLSARVQGRTLQLTAPAGGVTLTALNGRVLGTSTNSGAHQWSNLPSGLLIARTLTGSQTILIP